MSEPQQPPAVPSQGERCRQAARPRSRRWLAFFLVLALLGLTAVILPLVVNLRLQLRPEQIAEARQRWRAHAPAGYDLEYQVQNDIAGEITLDEYLVQVRDRRPTRVKVNGEEVPLHAAARRGVEGLFDEMERRLQEDQAGGERSYATATFDPHDGHPIRYVHRSRRARTRVEWNLKLTPRP